MAWKTPDAEAARAAAEKVLPTLAALTTDDRRGPALVAVDPCSSLEPIAGELLRKLSLVAAEKWGSVWAADERESHELATAALAVVRAEAPDLESELADPWTKLLFVAGMYGLPRVLSIHLGTAKPTQQDSKEKANDAEPATVA